MPYGYLYVLINEWEDRYTRSSIQTAKLNAVSLVLFSFQNCKSAGVGG